MAMNVSIERCWKLFRPVWVFFFAGGFSAMLLATPKFYEEHPSIAWPIFFSWVIISGLYMVYLKGPMLRIVLDTSMRTGTRNVLFVLSGLLMGVLGGVLGFWLKGALGG